MVASGGWWLAVASVVMVGGGGWWVVVGDASIHPVLRMATKSVPLYKRPASIYRYICSLLSGYGWPL